MMPFNVAELVALGSVDHAMVGPAERVDFVDGVVDWEIANARGPLLLDAHALAREAPWQI